MMLKQFVECRPVSIKDVTMPGATIKTFFDPVRSEKLGDLTIPLYAL